MKLLFALLLALPTLAQAAPFTAPDKVQGSQYLFRGAQPLGHVDTLKSSAIDEVLIFKQDTRGEVVREIAELKEAGYSESQIHHVPMKWKEIDITEACGHTIKALQVLMKAEREGTSTFFHCTAGEDRTGMVAGLARMLLTHETGEAVFDEEMCANGYSDGNPNKPSTVTGAIEQGLTPLFFALAEKIEAGDISTENLLPAICEKIEVKPVVRKCNP